jgi:hypothetical protein
MGLPRLPRVALPSRLFLGNQRPAPEAQYLKPDAQYLTSGTR